MKINCIAIDDEPPAIAQMEDYIKRVPYLNLLTTFDNAFDALSYLKEHDVDLLFLDIQMEGFTGIQLLNVLKKRPKIVLTTAYDQYALKAFELEVTDYLLKPIAFERFVQAAEKVYLQLQKPEIHPTVPVVNIKSEPDFPQFMFVKTEYRMQRINFADILFIEGLKEYLIIQMPKSKVLTLQSFKKIEEMLPPNNFVRVHKSFIVALDKIESIERNRIKIGERLIPIGESFSKNFYNLLSERKLF